MMTSKPSLFKNSARTGLNRDPGVEAPEPGATSANRLKQSGREEAKFLERAEASLIESERRARRQAVLIAELRAGGATTAEAEKSLVRLEAAVVEQRVLRDVALAKAKNVDITGV